MASVPTSERQETPLGAPQIYVENVGVTPPSVPREVVDDDVDDGEAESKCCQPSETTMFVLTVIFILPIGVICLSFIFGGLLAAVEGWNIMDGFYYSVSALCGLPEALTDVSPDSTSGKFADIVIAVWSLSVAGTFIGLIAGMGLVGKLTDFIEKAGALPDISQVDKKELMMALTTSTENGATVNFVGFKKIMRDVGMTAPAKELKKLFNKFDKDGSDDLDTSEVAAIGEMFDKAAALGDDDMSDEQWTKGASVHADQWQVMQNQTKLAGDLAEVKTQVAALEQMMQKIYAKICEDQVVDT